MTTYRHVRATVDAGVGTLLLDRPDKMNAFEGTMRREMVEAARSLVEDPAVRVLVVTGAGRAFCAGADVGYMREALAAQDWESAMGLVLSGGELVRLFREAPKPVLASLNGPAAGGGANLALACDLRIASDRASIGQVFHRIGLHPDMGGTFFLPQLVGPSRALELIWSAEMVPADRCLALGLVNRVVPHEELPAATATWARELAAAPPMAAALAKAAIRRAAEGAGLAELLELENEHQLRCFRSADAAEGLAAYAEKRPPIFHGR